jgi:hypothetical protein
MLSLSHWLNVFMCGSSLVEAMAAMWAMGIAGEVKATLEGP